MRGLLLVLGTVLLAGCTTPGMMMSTSTQQAASAQREAPPPPQLRWAPKQSQNGWPVLGYRPSPQ